MNPTLADRGREAVQNTRGLTFPAFSRGLCILGKCVLCVVTSQAWTPRPARGLPPARRGPAPDPSVLVLEESVGWEGRGGPGLVRLS